MEAQDTLKRHSAGPVTPRGPERGDEGPGSLEISAEITTQLEIRHHFLRTWLIITIG